MHNLLAIIILAVMVLFLVIVGLVQLREMRRMALRLSYLEGTTDIIAASQLRMNELIIALLEN